jgi:formylglycine-generating enzyme required for sulfatase activity
MGKAEQDARLRVYRGGSWYSSPAFARVASRFGLAPGNRSGSLGVRLVRRRTALEWLVEGLREGSDEQEEG